jgi:hypothetical protein
MTSGSKHAINNAWLSYYAKRSDKGPGKVMRTVVHYIMDTENICLVRTGFNKFTEITSMEYMTVY